MRARARCSALFTAATVMSRIAATSAAEKASTSRRISTARCRGGNTCRLAISASRRLARAATISAGSDVGWLSIGNGSRNRTCDSANSSGASGSWVGPIKPDGNTRRLRCARADRQVLVAMR